VKLRPLKRNKTKLLVTSFKLLSFPRRMNFGKPSPGSQGSSTHMAHQAAIVDMDTVEDNADRGESKTDAETNMLRMQLRKKAMDMAAMDTDTTELMIRLKLWLLPSLTPDQPLLISSRNQKTS
jgi:hypothetical protein